MTTPARQAEADRVEAVFHAALTQLGVSSMEEALALWQSVPPASMARLRTSWLRRIIRILMGHRSEARSMGRAYYRLVRALRTGSTIADPYKPEPRYITLDVLRSEFEALVPTPGAQEPRQERGSEPVPTTDTPKPSESAQDDGEPDDEPSDTDEADRILVEEIAELEAEAERQEREAEQEAALVLEALGPDNFDRKVDELDGQLPFDEIDAERNEVYRQAGARQAAAVDRLVQNGARAEIWTASQRDPRAIGYVRMSRTGTPCGFCAMLISRGFVRKDAYRSQTAAGPTLAQLESGEYADGDKYHDNCHCYAMPVFDPAQFDNSPMFALNRQYAGQWKDVTGGLSDKSAMTAWRAFVRMQQADQRAQAARSATDAQEA